MRLCSLAAVGAVLLATSPVAAQQPAPDLPDPRIAQLVAAVSAERLERLMTTLAAFGTRETMSDTLSTTRGIGAARRWIHEELRRSSPRLQVSYDTHRLPPQGRILQPVELRNVMAVLPGRTARRIYISGHYDSSNLGPGAQLAGNVRAADAPPMADPQRQPGFDHNADAPGANDDGSGTALTMELARVFAASGITFDATLVFICWAGEEQGLFGSRAHTQALQAAKVPVDALFNNDIVGNVTDGNGVTDGASVRVYSIGPEDGLSRSLARHIRQQAAIYVPAHRIRLMAREDRFARGSDHSSFTQFDMPAVVFREARENFARQHSKDDTPDGVDARYLAANARVNAAAAAALALAPSAPSVVGARGQMLISRDPSGYDATLRWSPVPGAVAYRIHWRDTWTYDWTHRMDVGNVTRVTLPGVSIDDYVFGVSAIGADGHESLVRAYVAPSRRMEPVTTEAPAPR